MTLYDLLMLLVVVPTPADPAADPPAIETRATESKPKTLKERRAAAPYRRHAIGSSAFMLMNVLPDPEPPWFFMLSYAYRLTPKDVISVEAITWKYYGPLGRQWWHSGDNYPGSVRSVGVGAAYQRFLWRGLYVGVHATPFVQTFLDPEGKKIKHGFQLFMTARVGYHVELFNNRVFLEPSIAATSWPINTGLPGGFAEEEKNWGKIFWFEPGLHFGVKF